MFFRLFSGITNFDLLGDFGAIEWLGNFQIVLLYNLVFGTTTALIVANKFTATVRQELCARLVENYVIFTNYMSFINWYLLKRRTKIIPLSTTTTASDHNHHHFQQQQHNNNSNHTSKISLSLKSSLNHPNSAVNPITVEAASSLSLIVWRRMGQQVNENGFLVSFLRTFANFYARRLKINS